MTEIQQLARLLRESTDPDNPSPEELRGIVRSLTTIAVVGLSRDPMKAARRVPSYLSAKGFEVIGVNPYAERLLGRPAMSRLAEVEEPIDLVLVFRPSDEAGGVVAEAAARPEKPVIWLQEGIRSDEAARRARESGSVVVQDLCLFKVHRALGDGLPVPVPRR